MTQPRIKYTFGALSLALLSGSFGSQARPDLGEQVYLVAGVNRSYFVVPVSLGGKRVRFAVSLPSVVSR